MMLQTAEVFGPTWQGEGPIDQQAFFVRTQQCGVGCTWCDSKFTWVSKPELNRSIDSIIAELEERAGEISTCIVSGGEPFMQAEAVAELSGRLVGKGWRVQFETSGTAMPSPSQNPLCEFVVSPKPPSAQTKIPTNPAAIEWFRDHQAFFKFVVKDEADLDYIKKFVSDYKLTDRRVYLMPEGINGAQIQHSLQTIWNSKVHPDWHLTDRKHIQAWGPKRGV